LISVPALRAELILLCKNQNIPCKIKLAKKIKEFVNKISNMKNYMIFFDGISDSEASLLRTAVLSDALAESKILLVSRVSFLVGVP
jgi:valyl-tRNA synthetase